MSSGIRRNFIISLAFIILVVLSACQAPAESDDARLAKDSVATTELARLNALLASSQPVSKHDVDTLARLHGQYPSSSVVRRLFQGALIKREDWTAAEKVISEVPPEARTPTDRLNLAKIYLKQGRFHDAAEFLRSLGNDNKQDVEVTALLGQAKFYDGKLDEAAIALESVLSALVKGKRVDELSMLGTIYFRRGDNEKAIRILQQAVEIAPENIPANNAISRVYAALGNNAKADFHRSKLQLLTERNEVAEKKKWRMVPLFYQLEDAHAAKDFAKVITLVHQIQPEADDATKAVLYQYLGAAYKAQGKDAEAKSALAEAAKLSQK